MPSKKTATPKPKSNSKKPVDPWHVVSGSSIHNRGIFAAKDIPKGTRVLEYYGEKITKKESLRRAQERMARAKETGEAAVYIFDLNSRYDLDGSSVENNDAMFINHACEPNCEAVQEGNRIFIETLKSVKKGDELLYNYGFDLDHWDEHECRCGSPNCVGFIVDRKYWRKLLKIIEARAAKVREGKRNGSKEPAPVKAAKKAAKKAAGARKKGK